MKKDLLKLNKKNENYKIEFETNINDGLKFFDTFMQFVSLKNNIKYNKVERNEYNSIKMARNKNELLNEFIELFTNTKEGKEIINDIKELYAETFDSNVSDVDTRELLEKGKQQEIVLDDKLNDEYLIFRNDILKRISNQVQNNLLKKEIKKGIEVFNKKEEFKDLLNYKVILNELKETYKKIPTNNDFINQSDYIFSIEDVEKPKEFLKDEELEKDIVKTTKEFIKISYFRTQNKEVQYYNPDEEGTFKKYVQYYIYILKLDYIKYRNIEQYYRSFEYLKNMPFEIVKKIEIVEEEKPFQLLKKVKK